MWLHRFVVALRNHTPHTRTHNTRTYILHTETHTHTHACNTSHTHTHTHIQSFTHLYTHTRAHTTHILPLLPCNSHTHNHHTRTHTHTHTHTAAQYPYPPIRNSIRDTTYRVPTGYAKLMSGCTGPMEDSLFMVRACTMCSGCVGVGWVCVWVCWRVCVCVCGWCSRLLW